MILLGHRREGPGSSLQKLEPALLKLPGLCAVSKQPKIKMDEEAVGATDNIVTEFATYEDFLDSQITPLDLYYLEVLMVLILTCFLLELTIHLFFERTL